MSSLAATEAVARGRRLAARLNARTLIMAHVEGHCNRRQATQPFLALARNSARCAWHAASTSLWSRPTRSPSQRSASSLIV